MSRKSSEIPWQLRMFSRSLKKRQKLELLLDQIGDTGNMRCLLITNGDNNGALNYHFRSHGGGWTWVENEGENIREMELFLGERIRRGDGRRLPLEDATFDVVVSIDVHEHLADCSGFNRELYRVVKPGGTVVVTTPNGDPWKPVTVLKQLIGMTKERYGHCVIGYNIRQHRRMLEDAGLVPIAAGSYSKFFTELLELAINFAYVTSSSRKNRDQKRIAPGSSRELRSVEKQYRVYSAIYPVLWGVSRLDRLLFMFTGYAVSVVARRSAQ